MYLRGGKFNLPMRSEEVLQLIYGQMGITRSPVAPIPANFSCGPLEIDGVTVVVKQRNPAAPRKRPHRIFVQCACGKEIPAGRLAQHLKFMRCYARRDAMVKAARNQVQAADEAARKAEHANDDM